MRYQRQILRTEGFRDEIDDIVKQDTMSRADHLKIVRDSFPRIAKKIDLMWGHQGMQDMFTKWLITDMTDRSGHPRQGWPRVVRRSLAVLAGKHSSEFNFESVPRWDWPADRWE